MTSRKIQKSKSGSYLITLPKSWVENIDLGKGSRIDIKIEEDDTLRITPPSEGPKPKNRFELKLENYQKLEFLENIIKACYMQGGEEIRVVSEKGTITDEKERLRGILPDLIASEVTQDRTNRFVIRVLADPRSFTIKDLLERIADLIFSIHKDTVKALQHESTELASDASYRGVDINRLHRLTMRQLSLSMDDRRTAESIGINNHMECLLYAVSFRDLCRMGYHVKRAADIVGNLENSPKDKILQTFLKMAEILSKMKENSVKSLARADTEIAYEVLKDMGKIRKYDQKITNEILNESLDTKKSFALNSLSTNWRRAAGHAVGVADIATSLAATRIKKRE